MAFYLEPLHDGGRQIVLDKAVVLIGRQAECDVILNDSRKVSRKHCCIAQVNEKYVVRDLASMNGVRVNGERIKREAEVRIGDEISIGDVAYVLRDTNADPMSDANGRDKSAVPVAEGVAEESEDSAVEEAPCERKPPKRPSDQPMVNISQKFPVPIADDGEAVEFAVEQSIQIERSPLLEQQDEQAAEDIVIEDSGELSDQKP